MNTEKFLHAAAALLEPYAKEVSWHGQHRLDVVIAPESLPDAADTLIAAHWGHLSAITGIDLGPIAGMMDVLYHFTCSDALLTVRVQIPRSQPSVPTISDRLPAAELYEHELQEILGIAVTGLPDSDRMFISDDWPAGEYPLRKDWVPSPATAILADAEEDHPDAHHD